jgi:hypothetical protein
MISGRHGALVEIQIYNVILAGGYRGRAKCRDDNCMPKKGEAHEKNEIP